VIIVFSKEIVQIIYPKFQTAALFLSTYSVLYLLVGIGYLTLTSFFNGLGETRITLRITVIAFAILVPLSPFLATFYGVLGVIIALLVANTAGAVYGMYVALTRFHIRFDMSALIKIYVAAAVSALPPMLLLQVSPLSQLFNVIAGGLIYIAIYLTLAPLIGIVTKPELSMISHVAQRIKPLAPAIKPLLRYQERILNSQK
jgi:O-antigen/teichoic acid export membrane protein